MMNLYKLLGTVFGFEMSKLLQGMFVRERYMTQVRYIALTLFFVPPLLLLTALDLDGQKPVLKLDDVPFEFNRSQFSGEACLSMCLRSMGHDTNADLVFDRSGVDPILGRGCHGHELIDAAANFGCASERMQKSFAASDRWKNLTKCWDHIKRNLERDLPTIVLCQLGTDVAHQGQPQFLLVVGFDEATDQVIVHRPQVEDGRFKRLDRQLFLNQMSLPSEFNDGTNDETNDRLEATEDQLTVFCMCLTGAQNQVQQRKSKFSDADFAKHIGKLRKKLPSDKFSIVIQKPFVVIGDESAQRVGQRAKNTVKWAVDRLKQDYFKTDPKHIVDIWLFKDKASYEKHTKQLFGSVPHTPFGYYSSTDRSLVMNISTGGGTLVHEIVHPFIESNFPDCPSWFNEGLASLYEQCRDRKGHIWGSTNWRLRGLQLTIEDGRLPKFKELCGTTTNEFYREDPGSNYGQARYLCYYLQQQNKLIEFYKAFAKNVARDKTGYETLQQTLGNPDMEQFQREWEKYVLTLRFPE